MASSISVINFIVYASFAVYVFGFAVEGLVYKFEREAPKWPKGIVFYYMDTKSYDFWVSQRLRFVMNTIESASCLKFQPLLVHPKDNKTWLHISNPSLQRECMHEPIYKDTGEVKLVLGLDCLNEQQLLHTILHGIGFKDEVSHPQRDQYIRVIWDNIYPANHTLYRIRPYDPSKQLVEYDPMSVMHFHDRAFSFNGHPTIVPLVPGLLINPSKDLSQLDKMKLRLFFGHECNKRKVSDLLETCKVVLHDGPKDKNKSVLTSSEYASDEKIKGVNENNSQNYIHEENSVGNNDTKSLERESKEVYKDDKYLHNNKNIDEGSESDINNETENKKVKEGNDFKINENFSEEEEETRNENEN